MSLFNELKRRNVFRVGIAYVVTGWILLQGADLALDLIGAPIWVIRSIAAVVMIGLPPALFFSWAFEVTPEGIKRESEVDRSASVTSQTGKKLNVAILVLLVVAMAYFVWESRFAGQLSEPAMAENMTSEPIEDNQVEAEPAVDPKSIAVLPFDNRSLLKEDVFFVEGIHDDLLNNLARIGSLKVISRTSVNLYRDSEQPLPQIAKELGVATVMEGAVQRSGDTVRINVELIDAKTDEHIWAEIYDRKLTAENLFAIQSEISNAIADALQATLSPLEKERINSVPTKNLAAYNAYLLGNQLLASRTVDNIEKAVGEFQKAVMLDPEFALAWVGVANSHLLSWNYGSLDAQRAYATMEEAAKRALDIDPNLGEAYATLGQVYGGYYKRYGEMEEAFEKAIQLSPNYATAWQWYSIENAYSPLRYRKSVELAERAAELDPRSLIIQSNLATAYRRLGLYSLSELQLVNTLELNPDFAQGWGNLARLYLFNMGRLDDAYKAVLQAREKDPDSDGARMTHAIILLQLGDVEAAEALLREMETESANDGRTGLISMEINLAKENFQGMREAANWVYSVISGRPFFNFNAVAIPELVDSNVARAREIYLTQNPGWTDPSQWQRLIEKWPDNVCPVAWTLHHTGDEDLANELLQQALVFHETILPNAIEHADQLRPDVCYAMAGDTEKALSSIETQLDHNHLFGRRNYDRLPIFDQIRHEPRYQAAMAEYERRIAEQRKRVVY